MRQTTSKRWFVVLVAVALFLAYVFSRDTLRVHGSFSPEERRQIVAGIQEWNAPKFFRHIEITRTSADTATAQVQEDRAHWSVTVFAKESGGWKKTSWYLLEKDTQAFPE